MTRGDGSSAADASSGTPRTRARGGAWLDDFRWGHFLLAALNYALFFAVFAVVAFYGRLQVALILAPAIVLPLLTLHLRRVVDLRSALSPQSL